MSQARDFADSFSAVSTGRRNLIINGAMQVAQRSTSETGLGSGDGYKTIDRYQAQFNTAARFTFSQETSDVPDGFSSAFKIATTTADTTVAAGEYVVIQQPIEAQNLQHLKVGSSDAESLTFSFYAKANASATYMVELQTLDGTVKNAQHQFTVTDSWQRFSVTFKGNTAGTINNDTGPGLEVKFWLHAGSDFNSGTYTAGEFSSNTSADRAVGIDSIADSTSRTLLFTGWQLEVGNSASPFEHRSYGEELALCQRYYEKGGYPSTTDPGTALTSELFYSTTDGFSLDSGFQFKVEKRANPTVTIYNAKDGTSGEARKWDSADVAAVGGHISTKGTLVQLTGGGQSTTSFYAFNLTADAEL
jgi:hypothetical protein